MKFLRTNNARNILLTLVENDEEVLENARVIPANTTDAALEKHVPEMKINGNEVEVKVGSIAHPMLPEHHISFIALETNMGLNIANLEVGKPAEAKFILRENEVVIAVYEYCNLHGLWKLENK